MPRAVRLRPARQRALALRDETALFCQVFPRPADVVPKSCFKLALKTRTENRIFILKLALKTRTRLQKNEN